MKDFYFIKKQVENILKKLGISKFKSLNDIGMGMSYSLTYSCNNNRLVSFGKVNTILCNEFGIKKDVFMADFNWDSILKITTDNKMQFEEISKFPSIRRDLSLLIDKSITFDDLQKIANNVENKILKSINLFDVYEGKQLSKEKKSYSMAFTFEDSSKTLTDKYVDKIMGKLIKSFLDKAGAEIR